MEWDEIRAILDERIPINPAKNKVEQMEREHNKAKTINWIIARMMAGVRPGGTRQLAPLYTQTFPPNLLWKAVRYALLCKHQTCYFCDSKAEEVHHIWPRALQGSEFDPCNLVCVCAECHDYIHRRLDEKFQLAIKDATQIATTGGIE